VCSSDLFTRICPQAAAPDRTRTPTAAATHEPSSSGDAEPVPDASTPHKAGSGSLRTRSPKPSAASTSPTAGSAAPSTAAATSPTATPSAASTSASAAAAAGTDDDGGGNPPWAGLAVGAFLASGLGGAALVRARRGAS